MADLKLPWTKEGDDDNWDMPTKDGAAVCGAAPFFDARGELIGYAVNVGWNEKDAERRDFIIQAVNSHASQASRIEVLEKALKRIASAKYPVPETLYAHRSVIDHCRDQARLALGEQSNG